MFKEHERIILTQDIPQEGLKTGDVGTIVHIYPQGVAFEVEFVSLTGDTAAMATVPVAHLRAVTSQDMTHARLMEAHA